MNNLYIGLTNNTVVYLLQGKNGNNQIYLEKSNIDEITTLDNNFNQCQLNIKYYPSNFGKVIGYHSYNFINISTFDNYFLIFSDDGYILPIFTCNNLDNYTNLKHIINLLQADVPSGKINTPKKYKSIVKGYNGEIFAINDNFEVTMIRNGEIIIIGDIKCVSIVCFDNRAMLLDVNRDIWLMSNLQQPFLRKLNLNFDVLDIIPTITYYPDRFLLLTRSIALICNFKNNGLEIIKQIGINNKIISKCNADIIISDKEFNLILDDDKTQKANIDITSCYYLCDRKHFQNNIRTYRYIYFTNELGYLYLTTNDDISFNNSIDPVVINKKHVRLPLKNNKIVIEPICNNKFV